jgi:hypothetical protein
LIGTKKKLVKAEFERLEIRHKCVKRLRT